MPRGAPFIDIRPLLLVNGVFLCGMAATMLIPAMVDWYHHNRDAEVFLASAAVTLFIGMSLYISNRGYRMRELSLREAFLLTATVWFVMPVFASFPFLFSHLNMDWSDAYFESVSALTTTGATVLTGLDGLPPGMLLWRSLLHFIGGMGIIVLAVAVLPILGVGGMQLFRTESSDKSDKILPRARQISSVIALTYIWLNILCAISYWMAGMSGFDAINHAMSTMATGGFSTHDASIGYFKSPTLEWITAFYMVLAGVPLLMLYQVYTQLARGTALSFWKDKQLQWYLGITLLCTMLLFVWQWGGQIHENAWTALRHAFFHTASVLSSTGFAAHDYATWGSFSTVFFFLILTIGGCTGSTAGGIKIFRLQVLFETAKIQLKQLIEPHGVLRARYNGRPIDPKVMTAVTSFIVLWGVSFMVLAAAVSIYGLDFETAMSAVAACMANVGPGIGKIIGPAGNFSTLPSESLVILSFAMLLGRLELFTVLVIFAPSFWRD